MSVRDWSSLDCAKLKNRSVHFRDGDIKRKRESGEYEEDEDEDESFGRREGTMVREFEVNQEDNDTDEVDGFDDFQEEVYDDSAGRQTDQRMSKTKILHSWGGWESELRRATTSAGQGLEEHLYAPNGFA